MEDSTPSGTSFSDCVRLSFVRGMANSKAVAAALSTRCSPVHQLASTTQGVIILLQSHRLEGNEFDSGTVARKHTSSGRA